MNKKTLQQLKPMLIISAIVVLCLFALSAYAWAKVPAEASIPVHFNAAGEADRYGGKFEGLLLLPIIVTAVVALFAFIPRLDPHGDNIMRSRTAYFATWAILLAFMLLMHTAIILTVLGVGINLFSFMPLALGLIFIVLGNYMGKIRHNYMFGIRTPWTLASEQSWNKTHRLGGKLFILLGLLMMVSMFLLSPDSWVYVIVGGTFALVGVLMVYSYLVWRQDPKVQGS